MNKQRATLQLLKKSPKGVTVLDVWKKVGTCQVYDIMKKLRDKGFKIECKRTDGKDRFGNVVHYGVYKLR